MIIIVVVGLLLLLRVVWAYSVLITFLIICTDSRSDGDLIGQGKVLVKVVQMKVDRIH